MPASVAQHVRMRIGQTPTFASRCHHLAHVRSGHWLTITLASKHKCPSSSASYFTQRPQFIALNWVNASNTSFQSTHMQMRPGEVDLIPFKIDCLTDAQAVPCHD